jgi:hypothetical protein
MAVSSSEVAPRFRRRIAIEPAVLRVDSTPIPNRRNAKSFAQTKELFVHHAALPSEAAVGESVRE